MDETANELLSRYLDGDLSPDEERELRARLEADDSLAAQLRGLRSVRESVAALAACERVPDELDSVLKPLSGSRPDLQSARPWAQWLATAAVVVLGLTVIIEVNRRDPGPDIRSIARRAEQISSQSEEPFALAPLPTSSLPVDEQPLGASDRLLASPVPEVETGPPPPLEVLGPLEHVLGDREEAEASTDGTIDTVAVGAVTSEKKAVAARREKASPLAAEGDPAPSPQPPRQGEGREIELDTTDHLWRTDAPKGRVQLFVFDNGKSAWREFSPSHSCKPGRYMVRINVRDGVVSEARPVGGAAAGSPSQRLCAAELVIDLEIDEVTDGEYQAEIVVEHR